MKLGIGGEYKSILNQSLIHFCFKRAEVQSFEKIRGGTCKIFTASLSSARSKNAST